ncbi:hypothetical protein ACLOJK_027568 [Asimina triloba]
MWRPKGFHFFSHPPAPLPLRRSFLVTDLLLLPICYCRRRSAVVVLTPPIIVFLPSSSSPICCRHRFSLSSSSPMRRCHSRCHRLPPVVLLPFIGINVPHPSTSSCRSSRRPVIHRRLLPLLSSSCRVSPASSPLSSHCLSPPSIALTDHATINWISFSFLSHDTKCRW